MASTLCPRCQSRCVVGHSCLACGHAVRELPSWMEPTGATLLPARIADRLDATEDDDEERRA
jgi:hypothetical protein